MQNDITLKKHNTDINTTNFNKKNQFEKIMTNEQFNAIYKKVFAFFWVKVRIFTIPKKGNVSYKSFLMYLSLQLQSFVGFEQYKKLLIKIDLVNFQNGEVIADLNNQIKSDELINLKISDTEHKLTWYSQVQVKVGDDWNIIDDENKWNIQNDEGFLYYVTELLPYLLKNPLLDLQNIISVSDTWIDVIEFLKKDIKNKGVSNQLVDDIYVEEYSKKPLNLKLINDGVTTSSCCKFFKITFKNHKKIPETVHKLCFQNISLKPIYFENFINYLAKLNNENAFDLQLEIDLDHSWLEVYEVVKKQIIDKKIVESNLFDDIKVSNYLGKDLNSKISDEGFSSTTAFKTFAFELNDLSKTQKSVKIDFKNIFIMSQTIFKRAVSKVKAFNLNNRFDLSSLTYYNTYGEALNLFKSMFNNDQDFKYITFVSITALYMEMTEANQYRGDHYQIIKLETTHGNKSRYYSGDIHIHYKNIKTAQEVLKSAQKKVQKFDSDHRFNMMQLTVQQTFGDALEIVKQYFKNDHDFKKIKWISKTDSSKFLKDSEFDSDGGRQYQIIRLELDGQETENFNIYYEFIKDLEEVARTLEIAKSVIEKFNETNCFSLVGLTTENTFNDALEKVKQYFKNDAGTFEYVKWISVTDPHKKLGGDSDFQDGKQYQTIKLMYGNFENKAFNIYYKDIKKSV